MKQNGDFAEVSYFVGVPTHFDFEHFIEQADAFYQLCEDVLGKADLTAPASTSRQDIAQCALFPNQQADSRGR